MPFLAIGLCMMIPFTVVLIGFMIGFVVGTELMYRECVKWRNLYMRKDRGYKW